MTEHCKTSAIALAETHGWSHIVLSGDSKQALPVIPKGIRVNEIQACLISSHLWHHILTSSLSTNMRAHLLVTNYVNHFHKICCNLEMAKFHSIMMVSFLFSQSTLLLSQLKKLLLKSFQIPSSTFTVFTSASVKELTPKMSQLIPSIADC